MVDTSCFSGKHSKYSRFRRNIMTPLNWLTTILSPVFFYGVIGASDLWVKIFSAALVVILIVMYVTIFLYVLNKAPQRLQTEGSNLEEKALNYLVPDSEKEITIKADPVKQTLNISRDGEKINTM